MGGTAIEDVADAHPDKIHKVRARARARARRRRRRSKGRRRDGN